MADPAIDEGLLRYFTIRAVERADQVSLVLGRMTERERRLVREAAVMGYVQGVRSMPGGHKEAIPPDSLVVYRVVSACLIMDDLYPVMNGLADELPEEPGVDGG